MSGRPVLMMVLGFFCLLMVLNEIPSTYFLNFLAFTLSTGGLILGIVGATFYVRLRNK